MLRVTTRFAGPEGAPWFSTFHFAGTALPDAAEAVVSTELFWIELRTLIANNVQMTVGFDGVQDVDPSTGQTIAVHYPEERIVAGGGLGSALPQATQGLIRWRTGVFVAGREIRGRSFIPGLTSAAQAATGNPGQSLIDAVEAAVPQVIASVDNGLGVYSRTRGQFESATAGTLWGEFAVLRSRRD